MRRYTAKQLARMGKLFSQNGATERDLLDEAEFAGVGLRARNAGLTLDQWGIVRNAKVTLRAAVLALEPLEDGDDEG